MNAESDLAERIATGAHRGPRSPRPPPPTDWRQPPRPSGLLDVAYRTVDSPVGSLLLAATDTGLVRVAYANEDHDRVLQTLSDRISPRILHHPPVSTPRPASSTSTSPDADERSA